jgi:uncharacterized protein YbjT (DUF2867 family)
MTIVVTGATGLVGRRVVDQLLTAGQKVRAVTRDPATARLPGGVDVVRADLDEPGSLQPVLAGADRLYLFPRPDTARAVAELAHRAGVRRIVTLSSALAEQEPEDEMHHLAVERAVESVDVEWTHLRPGMFAANLLGWADSIRTEGVVREPVAAAAQAPVHESDIAAVAVAALLEEGHAGKRYRLSGPRTLTKREQAEAIGVGLERVIRFEEVTADRWRAAEGGRLPAEVAEFLLGVWVAAAKEPEPVLPTVREVTGRPARTLARWAADHAEEFGGARG